MSILQGHPRVRFIRWDMSIVFRRYNVVLGTKSPNRILRRANLAARKLFIAQFICNFNIQPNNQNGSNCVSLIDTNILSFKRVGDMRKQKNGIPSRVLKCPRWVPLRFVDSHIYFNSH